jgi:putative Mg2+ transporter-C (MgtC) family protein
MDLRPFLDLLRGEMSSGIVAKSLTRLVLAAILGGVIGLEREWKHKPAGLRTNMFICFGAALFTVLSRGLSESPSDYTRIAAQIIPGIGFIGAGSILHMKGLTTGLTTAATLFVVASVGMAAGGGLYLTAVFATGLVVLALVALGHLEGTFNLKRLMMTYEATGTSVEQVSREVNRILEGFHLMMLNVLTGDTGTHWRVQFDLEGTRREQKRLLQHLKESRVLASVVEVGPVDRE